MRLRADGFWREPPSDTIIIAEPAVSSMLDLLFLSDNLAISIFSAVFHKFVSSDLCGSSTNGGKLFSPKYPPRGACVGARLRRHASAWCVLSCAGDDALRHHGSAARCVCGADAANPSGDWLGRGPDYRGGAAFRLSDAARTFAGRSRYRREKPLLAQGGAGDSGSRSACHWRRTVAVGKFQPGRTGMVAVPGCRLSACRAFDASVLSEAAHGAAARVRGRAFKSAV